MKRENGKQLTRSRPRRLVEFAPQASRASGVAGRLPPEVILHPTDYSEASRQAFELACGLARDSGSRLVIMHVAEPVRVSSLGMVAPAPLPKGYRGAWESRLRLIQPHDPAVRVEHRLEEGDVADAILRVAREAEAGLIVMAGRERNWLGRLLTESVTEKVERKAPCPVLRLNAQRPGKAAEAAGGASSASERLNPKAILHPTDFSRPARHGFAVARSLARQSGSELIVAYVALSRDLHRSEAYREEIETTLRRMVASDPTVRARWVLLAGDPAAEILWMARESACDLIVMGTHDRTGLRHLFARSVAAEVRRKSPCPVVTVQIPPGRTRESSDETGVANQKPGGTWTCNTSIEATGSGTTAGGARRLRFVGDRMGWLQDVRRRRSAKASRCSEQLRKWA
jgi:nucleotide-binding universal stress UspA family protein